MRPTPQPTLPLAELELPRFQIFQGAKIAYVLRDNQAGLDYPFLTKSAARGAIKIRTDLARQFIGHPVDHDAYGVTGKPIEQAA